MSEEMDDMAVIVALEERMSGYWDDMRGCFAEELDPLCQRAAEMLRNPRLPEGYRVVRHPSGYLELQYRQGDKGFVMATKESTTLYQFLNNFLQEKQDGS